MATHNFQIEFPDFGEMDVAIPADFTDVSWRNEMCPSFSSSDARVILFIDFADPKEREFPESARFTLKATDETGILLDDPDGGLLIDSDDFGEVLRTIDGRRAELAARPAP